MGQGRGGGGIWGAKGPRLSGQPGWKIMRCPEGRERSARVGEGRLMGEGGYYYHQSLLLSVKLTMFLSVCSLVIKKLSTDNIVVHL